MRRILLQVACAAFLLMAAAPWEMAAASVAYHVVHDSGSSTVLHRTENGNRQQYALEASAPLMGDLQVSGGTLMFYVQGNGIFRRNLDGSGEFAVADNLATVTVKGYNLGESLSDVLSFSIDGFKCPQVIYVSSNELQCVMTKQVKAGFSAADVEVVTLGGADGNRRVSREGIIDPIKVQAWLIEGITAPFFTEASISSQTFWPLSIAVSSDGNDVYFALRDGRIGSVNIPTSRGVVIIPRSEATTEAHGLALEGTNLYHSSANVGAIYKTDLLNYASPGATKVVVSGLVRPRGLVLATGSKIYFTEEGRGISVAIEGGGVGTLATTTNLIRVDSRTRLSFIAKNAQHIFWTEHVNGESGRLMRATLKETGNEVSASFQELGRSVWPRGLGVAGGNVFVSELLGKVQRFSNSSVVPTTVIDHSFLGNGPLVADATAGAFLSSGL